MKRIAVAALSVMPLSSRALAKGMTAGLELDAEVKPASSYTAEINSAVYSPLDFEDTVEP